ncbi:MAG: tetratricopeptide repeat protein, partial [Mangrovibacterium sp.]
QKQLGNFDAAQQLLARCLEIDPLSAVSMYEMGRLHYNKKDLTSAALLFTKAVDVNPQNKWYKLTLADVFQQIGKYDLAAALYEDLYALEKLPKYVYNQAILWNMAAEYSKSLAAYDKFAKLTGKYDEVAMAKQSVYQQNGDTKTAIKDMQRLIKKQPLNSSYYGLLAELYHKEGNDQLAQASYEKVFEIEPDNGFACISVAGFYADQGNDEKAFEYVRRAMTSEQLDADTKIQFYLAEMSKDSVSWSNDQIDDLLKTLHNMYPEDERMYAVYADHLMRQGKVSEARENIAKFLEKNPQAQEMWWQSFLLANEQEDWEGIIAQSEQALIYFPEEANFLMWNALAQLQLERYEQALEAANKGLSLSGDDAFLQEQLQVFVADANYNLGRFDEALRVYKLVVKNNPTNYGALNNYAYYLSELNRDLDEAESCASRLVQANPTNSTFLDTYAWVLFKRGNYELAKFYQETAIENDDSITGLYFEHYGDILFKLGDEVKALEQWVKAKEIGEASELIDEKIKKKTYLEEK